MEKLEKLLSYMRIVGDDSSIQRKQTAHRMRLVEAFNIKPGSKVLEVGSGQGDTTVVLADAVGKNGHVDAVDIASSEYGAPLTLKEATDYISNSEIGNRVSFTFETNVSDDEFTGIYDVAILSHSLFYFKSYTELSDLFRKLRKMCHKICVADWDLEYSDLAQATHAEAILLQGLFSIHNEHENNIQLIIRKDIIEQLLIETGWTIDAMNIVDAKDLDDGRWEVAITNHIEIKEYPELFESFQQHLNTLEKFVGIKSLDSFVITANTVV